jgi:prepilin peptidase CpaA
MADLFALAAFAGLLLYAACSDVARLTIPNWVSVAMAALFVASALGAGAPLSEIGLHALFALTVLALGVFLFQANIIGGGDAKLLAAAALWTGFPAFAPFAFWTAIAGGLMALLLLAARKLIDQAETHPAFVKRLLKRQGRIPYGVAIMAGGLMALPALRFVLHPLTVP